MSYTDPFRPELIQLAEQHLDDGQFARNLVGGGAALARQDHEAFRICLAAATGLNLWKTGAHLADAVTHNADGEMRKIAAEFYLAYAGALRRRNRSKLADAQVEKALTVWPEGGSVST